MVESVITLLIYICVIVAVCWLVIWVLGQIGVPLPAQVIKIFWVIVALLIILLVWRALSGHVPMLRL